MDWRLGLLFLSPGMTATGGTVTAASTTDAITASSAYTLGTIELVVNYKLGDTDVTSTGIAGIALSDDNGYVWAWNSNTKTKVKSNSTDPVAKVVTVVLSYPTGEGAPDDATKIAMQGSYTATITKTGRVKTINRNTVGTPGTDSFADGSVTFDFSISDEGALQGASHSFLVAFDGEKANNEDYDTRDETAPSGTIGVTVANKLN